MHNLWHAGTPAKHGLDFQAIKPGYLNVLYQRLLDSHSLARHQVPEVPNCDSIIRWQVCAAIMTQKSVHFRLALILVSKGTSIHLHLLVLLPCTVFVIVVLVVHLCFWILLFF